MAAQGRTEPQRWSQRQRQGILQNQVRQKRQLETPGQRWRKHARKAAQEGQLSCPYGQRQRAADEGWQEDEIEALIRGMGASR